MDINTKKENSSYITIIEDIFKNLSPCINIFFRDNKIKFHFISKEKAKLRPCPEEFQEALSYGYSYLDKGEIYLIIPPINQDKEIKEHAYHEIGHFIFFYLIGLSAHNLDISKFLLLFCKESLLEGGFSILSNKYLKNIYGSIFRKNKKNIISGIDIKYHENFSEGFRLFLLKDFVSLEKRINSYKVFRELLKYVDL